MLSPAKLAQPAPVLVYGNPALRGVAKLVPANYPLEVINAHIKTMYDALMATRGPAGPGGSAIAATQIGLALRIFIAHESVEFPLYKYFDAVPPAVTLPVDSNANPIQCVGQGYVVFINPYFTDVSDSAVSEEGCLSIPSYNPGPLKRHRKFTLHFQQLSCDGTALVDRIISNYDGGYSNPGEDIIRAKQFCWMVQHEIDHLDGLFFIDQFGPPSPNDTPLNDIKSGAYTAPYATLPQPKA